MAFCSKCGKEVEEGASFCANCGAPVESTESVAVKTAADNINVGGQPAVETTAPTAPVEAEPVAPAVPAPAAPTAPALTASETQILDVAQKTTMGVSSNLSALLSKVPFLAKLTGSSDAAEPAISDADLSAMESQSAAGGIKYAHGNNVLILKENELVMNGETGFFIFKKKVNFSMPYSEIMFYDYTAVLFGLLGYKISGGANDQFALKGLTKDECLKIRSWLIAHGTKLSSKEQDAGKTFSGILFSLAKESITVMDDGISHSYKGIFKNRDTFIPYDKVDFFLISRRFLMFRDISVIGQLSFSTKGVFSAEAAAKAKSLLKAKTEKVENGKVYHPHIFSGVPGRGRISLVLFEDKILYMKKVGILGKQDEIILLRSVSSYSCKPIFSLFKRIACITGEGNVDLRSNTYREYEINFPGVFFFWWFCGPIKAACKRLSRR